MSSRRRGYVKYYALFDDGYVKLLLNEKNFFFDVAIASTELHITDEAVDFLVIIGVGFPDCGKVCRPASPGRMLGLKGV